MFFSRLHLITYNQPWQFISIPIDQHRLYANIYQIDHPNLKLLCSFLVKNHISNQQLIDPTKFIHILYIVYSMQWWEWQQSSALNTLDNRALSWMYVGPRRAAFCRFCSIMLLLLMWDNLKTCFLYRNIYMLRQMRLNVTCAAFDDSVCKCHLW